MNQFYMNEMTSYAASLTGAKGKAQDAETITVGPRQPAKSVEETSLKSDKNAEGRPKSKREETQEVHHPKFQNHSFLSYLRTILPL